MIGALLLATALACMDMGRYMASRTALRAAVGEVVRAAVTTPTLTGCEAPETYALTRVSMLDPAELTICVTRGTTTVTINASYRFAFVVPLLGEPRTLTAVVTHPL